MQIVDKLSQDNGATGDSGNRTEVAGMLRNLLADLDVDGTANLDKLQIYDGTLNTSGVVHHQLQQTYLK